ncbi:MAG: C-GCAxxG-C-C family (seleno)protein [Clostridiaceae bacterium]|nr:C-GCAxxG-C-C family (seleno)protein [Clostridia bacterium]MDY3870268.1 C-GCAxxG-C-C family (seleno)protein [Clostridiaceae bacterium]
MLQEHAKHFYLDDNCNCAEAVLLAANAEYGLGLPDDAVKLVGGFGAGMGCGNACGALCGAVAALGVMKMGRRAHETYGFGKECGDLVRAFEAEMGGTQCSVLRKVHANQEQRCLKSVLAACAVLESHLEETAK